MVEKCPNKDTSIISRFCPSYGFFPDFLVIKSENLIQKIQSVPHESIATRWNQATGPKNVASVRTDKAKVRRTKIRLGDLSYGMKKKVSVSRTKLRLEE